MWGLADIDVRNFPLFINSLALILRVAPAGSALGAGIHTATWGLSKMASKGVECKVYRLQKNDASSVHAKVSWGEKKKRLI